MPLFATLTWTSLSLQRAANQMSSQRLQTSGRIHELSRDCRWVCHQSPDLGFRVPWRLAGEAFKVIGLIIACACRTNLPVAWCKEVESRTQFLDCCFGESRQCLDPPAFGDASYFADDSKSWIRGYSRRWTTVVLAWIFSFAWGFFPLIFHAKSFTILIHSILGADIKFPLLFTEDLDFDLYPYLLVGDHGLGTVATSWLPRSISWKYIVKYIVRSKW